MWKAGLSITGTLLSFYAAGVSAQNGIMCSTDDIQGDIAYNEVETNVKNLAMEICETHLEGGGDDPYLRHADPGGFALTITHIDEDVGEIEMEECVSHFNDIVEQCVLGEGAWGGMANIDGFVYHVDQDDNLSPGSGKLEARKDKKPKKPKTPTVPKLPKKPDDKKPGKGKPTPSPKKTPIIKPTPTPKSTPTPKPTPSNGNSCAYVPGGKGGKKPGKGGKLSARAGCQRPVAIHDAWQNTEHYNTADKSDLVRSYQFCAAGKGKRSFLEAAFGAPQKKRSPAQPVVDSALEKRSGDRYAKTWDEWKLILEDIDNELGKILQTNNAAGKKITIIWAGGISAIALGARSTRTKAGKTGDIDFLYHTGTTAQEKTWFFEAVTTVVAKPTSDLPTRPPPITNSLELNSRKPIPQTRLAEWSKLSDKEPAAWSGTNFEAKHGDMLFQLYGKMARMYEMRKVRSKQDINANPPKQYGQHKDKDEVDAKLFFKLWTSKHGDLDIKDLMEVGRPGIFDKSKMDMELLVGNTIEIIAGKSLSKCSKSIKDLAEDEHASCKQWSTDNPRVEKPKKRPGA